MLLAFVLIPLLAVLAILGGTRARLAAIIAATANLALGLVAAFTHQASFWSFSVDVLQRPHIQLALGMDGMSLIMLLLSVLVTFAAVLTGKAPDSRQSLYYSSSLLISAGAIGAFLSTDLFFFYAFHELALIPTFLMIGILGRGDRRATAWKITVYLGFGSLVLLAGLVWLANAYGTFSIPQMLEIGSVLGAETQQSIAALLLVGFGILVSLFPFHSWAAPAYASAPAPTAMLHAGVLKKFGLYGILRLAVPLLPEGLSAWLVPLCVLLLGNIVWVGLVTISQKRLDGMLGNSSVMHMGYIFLGIAAVAASGPETRAIAVPAAIMLMFAHGLSIAMLFGLAEKIERSTGSLDLQDLGGLAKPAPALAFLFGLVAMASIGLPGLANFAGEIMIFISSFLDYDPAAGLGPVQITCIIAISGVVISAVYMLRAYRNIFHGPTVKATHEASDLGFLERIPAVLLASALVIVGIFPNLLLSFLK
ncbi:MAG: complex I subunit 4 family protein [Verrucomicrobiales bacterium]